MPPAFLRAYPPAQPPDGPALWLPFQGPDLLVPRREGAAALAHGPAEVLGALRPLAPPLYLGTLRGVPCFACEVAEGDAPPEGWRALGLRALFGQLDDLAYGLAGYAAQLLYWQRTSRFCAVCGQPTAQVPGDWGKRCTACGHTTYPRVSPAVLVLIHDGEQILLASKPGWGDRYSIIAGFVEPGESLEECVLRESHEEVGVELDDLRYVGSQPWPFPHQVMIGYTARYAGGEIQIDATELASAHWFHVDALPPLPPPLSLSRQMIDAWVATLRP